MKTTVPSLVRLVDDDAGVREALTAFLQMADYETAVFASAGYERARTAGGNEAARHCAPRHFSVGAR